MKLSGQVAEYVRTQLLGYTAPPCHVASQQRRQRGYEATATRLCSHAAIVLEGQGVLQLSQPIDLAIPKYCQRFHKRNPSRGILNRRIDKRRAKKSVEKLSIQN